LKRGTPNHPKTHRLAELLGISWATAVGHLELLFHFAGHYTPRGDIGRYGEKRLAGAVGWKGKPSKLIDALVEAGWLDRNPDETILLHDWDEHADRAVKKRLARGSNSGATRSKVGSNSVVTREQLGSYSEKYPSNSVATPISREVISSPFQEDTSKKGAQVGSDRKPKSVLPEPVPVSAPVPVPAPEPTKIKTLAPRKRAPGHEPDPRHTPFREATAKYWALKNGVAEMPWNGAAAKAMSDLLSANPLMTIDSFTDYLRNRWKSDLNHFERPSIWLRRITEFAGGPLDRFGKPLKIGGSVNGKGHAIIDAVNEAKRIGRAVGVAGSDGDEAGSES
jgi:hypothetical protein